MSAFFVMYLVGKVDAVDVINGLYSTNYFLVFTAFVLLALLSVLHAARWRAVIAMLASSLGYLSSLRIVFIGYFFNQVIPFSVGGDAFRSWFAYKEKVPLKDAIGSVVIDRMFAMAALILLIILSLPVLYHILKGSDVFISIVYLVLVLVAGAVTGIFILLFGKSWGGVIGRPITLIREYMMRISGDKEKLYYALVLSVLVHIGVALCMCLLFMAADINIPLYFVFVMVYPVTLVSVLPVSFAGWGVREGAMVYLFEAVGIDTADSLMVSVIYGLLLIVVGLPGGILWLRNSIRPVN